MLLCTCPTFLVTRRSELTAVIWIAYVPWRAFGNVMLWDLGWAMRPACHTNKFVPTVESAPGASGQLPLCCEGAWEARQSSAGAVWGWRDPPGASTAWNHPREPQGVAWGGRAADCRAASAVFVLGPSWSYCKQNMKYKKQNEAVSAWLSRAVRRCCFRVFCSVNSKICWFFLVAREKKYDL